MSAFQWGYKNSVAATLMGSRIITRVKKYEGKIICRSIVDTWTDGVLDDYKRLVSG